MPSAQLIARREHALDPALDARWCRVVTHTHNQRVRQVPFAQATANLVQWCGRHRVGALGLGSPWEPVSATSYGLHEGAERDRYDAGLIDPATVMDRAAVEGLIASLNATRPQTLFYLDNETPKARYGHLWWFGWHYDVPAWHDYSQDRPVAYHDDDPHTELNPLSGAPHRRRAYLAVVAGQRARGALAVWAHPTSWWTQGEAFITNIAAELPLHLACDGRLDGLAVMGYDACHRAYQALWWALLDTGAVVPGFAETDSCFDRANLLEDQAVLVNRFALGERATLPAIVAAARAGAGFATSGPFLTLTVDGCAMGGALASARGARHVATIEAHPAPGEGALGRVELIGRGGAVLASVERFTGGALEFAVDGDERGWLVARAFGEHDDPAAPRQQAIRHCALTNPVYLRAGANAGSVPATTASAGGAVVAALLSDTVVTVANDSPWLGGELRFEDAAGALLESGRVVPGDIARRLPASARLTLAHPDRPARTWYFSAENRAVQARLRYLWDGGFRADFPRLEAGDVPSAAFDLAGVRAALAEQRYRV